MSALSLKPGSVATYKGEIVTISAPVAIERVLVLKPNGDLEIVHVGALEPVDTKQSGTEKPVDLEAVPDAVWNEAVRRSEVIRDLANVPHVSWINMQTAAKDLGVSVRHVYSMLAPWRHAGGVVSALLPGKTGRRDGRRMVPNEVEIIIENTIDDLYMTRQRARKEDVVAEVVARCKTAGIKPPCGNTVRRRIGDRGEWASTVSRFGNKIARERLAPVLGHFPATGWPLQVLQIDHTPMDVMAVDQEFHLPLMRPYLTVALDVHTGVCAGFHLSGVTTRKCASTLRISGLPSRLGAGSQVQQRCG